MPTSTSDLTKIAAMARRDLARIDLLEFIRYVNPDYEPNWHHRLVANVIMAWLIGTTSDGAPAPGRVILEMPPAHGKSEIVSRGAPAFIMAALRHLQPRFMQRPPKLIAVSHTQDLANEMSSDVLQILRGELCAGLFGQTARERCNVEKWRTLDGAHYRCSGIGGPIAGKHMDFGIIDDPIKNPEEAFSPTMREKVWQWYTRVFRQRRIGNARMLLTTTRWHEDDLAARILKREPGKWHRVSIPAIAEKDGTYRKRGEALWPGRYPLSFLEEERELNPHAFNALYQQRPVAEGGGFIKRAWLNRRYTREGNLINLGDAGWRDLNGARRFGVVDPAASTKTTGDYTTIGAYASWPDGHMALIEMLRERLEGPDIVPQMALMLNRHELGDIWIERIGFQTALMQEASRKGLPVRELRPDKDKVTRAAPFASLAANGKFWLPQSAPWLADFEDEILSFPAAPHDDQMDNVAYATRVMQEQQGWKLHRTPI